MTGFGPLHLFGVDRRRFGPHLLIFAVVSVLALALEWLFGGDWPLFWPVMLLACALVAHYFVANALNVDEAWVEERTSDLQTRSYDFEHIRDIERRVDEGDRSVTPRAGQTRGDTDD